MPRQSRELKSGYSYHVTTRCNNRKFYLNYQYSIGDLPSWSVGADLLANGKRSNVKSSTTITDSSLASSFIVVMGVFEEFLYYGNEFGQLPNSASQNRGPPKSEVERRFMSPCVPGRN
jgi:hypothetical protein